MVHRITYPEKDPLLGVAEMAILCTFWAQMSPYLLCAGRFSLLGRNWILLFSIIIFVFVRCKTCLTMSRLKRMIKALKWSVLNLEKMFVRFDGKISIASHKSWKAAFFSKDLVSLATYFRPKQLFKKTDLNFSKQIFSWFSAKKLLLPTNTQCQTHLKWEARNEKQYIVNWYVPRFPSKHD